MRTASAVGELAGGGFATLRGPSRVARSYQERSLVLHICHRCNTPCRMKTLTVRLPEPLVADIEAESRGRKISKSDVVRERLERAPRQRRRTASLDAIVDLI